MERHLVQGGFEMKTLRDMGQILVNRKHNVLSAYKILLFFLFLPTYHVKKIGHPKKLVFF